MITSNYSGLQRATIGWTPRRIGSDQGVAGFKSCLPDFRSILTLLEISRLSGAVFLSSDERGDTRGTSGAAFAATSLGIAGMSIWLSPARKSPRVDAAAGAYPAHVEANRYGVLVLSYYTTARRLTSGAPRARRRT